MGKWDLDEVFDFTMEIASGEAGHTEFLAEKIARDTVARYCRDAKMFKNPSYRGIDVFYEASDRVAVRVSLWATRCSDNEEVSFVARQLWIFKTYESCSLGLEEIFIDMNLQNGLGFDFDVAPMLHPYFENDLIREVWGVV